MITGMITGMMLWPNLNKSKKMGVGSLWEGLPWFHNVFQAQKV